MRTRFGSGCVALLLATTPLVALPALSAQATPCPSELDSGTLHYTFPTADTAQVAGWASGYTPTPGTLTIPATVTEGECTWTVRSIRGGAFGGQSAVTGLVLPNTLQTIGDAAFNGSGLTGDLDLSGATSLTTIGIASFIGTASLGAVTLPASLTTMGNVAFNNSGLTSIDLSQTAITMIDTYTFGNAARLASVAFPTTLTTIASGAFQGSGLTGTVDLSVSTSLSTIGSSAFAYNTHLSNVLVPASLTSIGFNAFLGDAISGTLDLSGATSLQQIEMFAFTNNASMTGLKLPAHLQTIGMGAFVGTGLSGVLDLSSAFDLESIGVQAFTSVGTITGVVLPPNLVEIGDTAFLNMRSTFEVTFLGALPETVGSNVFIGQSHVSFCDVDSVIVNDTWTPANNDPYSATSTCYLTSYAETDGVLTVTDIQDAPLGGSFDEPAAPAVDGFTFGPWMTTLDFDTEASFPIAADGPVQVFAAGTALPTPSTPASSDEAAPASLATTGIDGANLALAALGALLLAVGGLVLTGAPRFRNRSC